MPIVKICGLSTPDTLDAALDAGADMVGFVFFARSPRSIATDLAATLGRRVKGRAQKIALTVDAGDAALEAIIRSLRPDALQLHGSETPDRIMAIKARFDLPVMKAIGVASRADLAVAKGFHATADWLLLDAKPGADARRPGGNGRAFDWTLLHHLDRSMPFMLSGGLDVSNVAEAVRTAMPHGVDVSSGVEDSPGLKNPDRIVAFIAAARAAYAEALAGETSR
jgi:phosphoribosylanthranilate isomerase